MDEAGVMRWTFDEDVQAFYAYFSWTPVASTRELADGTVVDLDADGGLVGVEILSIGRPWSDRELLLAVPLDDHDSLVLRRVVASLQVRARPAGSAATLQASA